MAKKPSRFTRKQRFMIRLCIVCLALVAVLVFIESKLSPLVEQMAVAKAQNIALNAINQAVYQEIENENITYSDLIEFEKDTQGNITALKTNIVKINALKTRITDRVLDNISKIDVAELRIPLGNIINGDFFSGRGPRIPINIVPLGSASATYKNVFISAGINQTRHQIVLVSQVSVSILLPADSISTTIESEVTIAETIIVGKVPESYTLIDLEPSNIYESYVK